MLSLRLSRRANISIKSTEINFISYNSNMVNLGYIAYLGNRRNSLNGFSVYNSRFALALDQLNCIKLALEY